MLNGFRSLPALVIAASLAAAPAARGSQGPYTSSRLTPELIERLLPGPIELIEAGDIVGAEQSFERQLAQAVQQYGPGSVAAGDLLAAFGLTLFHATHDPVIRRRAIVYLRRSADAYTAALGRNHPEVGLAMADVGQALLTLTPEGPAPEAEAALEDAWRIRQASLGPRNVETASSLSSLARVRGLPSHTRGERARIEASAALFREAIRDFGTLRVEPGLFGSISTRFELARMYLANGLVSEAAQAALDAQADYRANFAGEEEMCSLLVSHSRSFAHRLDREGHRQAGDAIRAGLEEGIPCHEPWDGDFPAPIFVPEPADLPPEPEPAPEPG
jgi:hypothetical protein